MDFFSELPPLLVGEILQRITAFESLQSVIVASPACYRVFRDQGPAIINTIATSALESEFNHILCTIARIRNQPVTRSIATLDLFQQIYAANLSNPERPSLLTVDMTPEVCFGLVSVAVNINKLATAVLDELLRRTSKLKPQHSVNRTIDFASGAYSRVPGSDPWPEARPATIAPSAIKRAPSWVEHHRVKRALWLLQLSLEVRSHAPWLAWHSAQEPQTGGWAASKLVSWLPLAIDINLVAKALEDDVATRVMPTWDGASSSNPTLISLTRMPRCVVNLGHEPSEKPRDDTIGTGWSQNRDAVNIKSDGRRILTQLLGSRHATLSLPMVQNIMYPGLVIWDRERLCDLGLIDEPRKGWGEENWWQNEDRRPQMSEDEIFFAWYSIACRPPAK